MKIDNGVNCISYCKNEAFEYTEEPRKNALKHFTTAKENTNETTNTKLTKEEKQIKLAILKNVIVISLSFTFLFTSFNSMSSLQSSLYQQMGTTMLGMIYLGTVLSCAFLPTILMKKIGNKRTLALSMFLYMPYLAATYLPNYYTFIPSGFLTGVAGATLWSSQSTYLTIIGIKYAKIVGENSSVVLTKFFGIFFLFLQTSQIWGNLFSSAVFSAGMEEVERSEEVLRTCGINSCPGFLLNLSSTTSFNSTEEDATALANTLQTKIFVMTAVYLILGLIASLLVVIFVDPLSRFGISKNDGTGDGQNIVSLLLATFNQAKRPYQLLIIPLTMYSGIELGFLTADYTAGYITCYFGVQMVGYVLICFGIFNSICSFGITPLIKRFKRISVMTVGAVLNALLIIALYIWKPDHQHSSVFFLVPTFWGTADAIWQTQINALYGIIFPGKTEAAFTNFRLWKSIGFFIAYCISGTFCMTFKLLVLLCFLCCGMIGYYTIEVLERKKYTQ